MGDENFEIDDELTGFSSSGGADGRDGAGRGAVGHGAAGHGTGGLANSPSEVNAITKRVAGLDFADAEANSATRDEANSATKKIDFSNMRVKGARGNKRRPPPPPPPSPEGFRPIGKKRRKRIIGLPLFLGQPKIW